MRKVTSSFGRRQFSLENAKRVRYSTPRLPQLFTTSRTASTPRRCPPTRGSRRFFAQRPLPSMMIATCRGTSAVSGITCVELSNSVNLAPRTSHLVPCSYGHQFPFLVRDELVDVRDRLVGHLLHLVLGALLLVLAHFGFLEQRLEVRDRVAADVAHGDLRVLAFVLDDLGHLAAALLGKRRHGHADDVAGGRRI